MRPLENKETASTAYNSRSLKCGLSNMQSYRTSSGAANVVCNAGRFGNYRAAARQPGIVPGKKKKMQNN